MERPRLLMRDDPYAHAPRLPEGSDIHPRDLFLDPPADAEASWPPSSPVELEIGPGRGWFTVERLELEPSSRVLGLEIRRKWASIVDERLRKRGLGHRGRVFAEDAKEALPRLAAQCVSIAYLHFPDPWWKKRHRKRLVVSDPVLQELSRVLVAGGELFIQTDVEERAREYERRVTESGSFEPWQETAQVDEHPHRARSPRERKAIEHGLPIYRLRYRCLGSSPAAGRIAPSQG